MSFLLSHFIIYELEQLKKRFVSVQDIRKVESGDINVYVCLFSMSIIKVDNIKEYR